MLAEFIVESILQEMPYPALLRALKKKKFWTARVGDDSTARQYPSGYGHITMAPEYIPDPKKEIEFFHGNKDYGHYDKNGNSTHDQKSRGLFTFRPDGSVVCNFHAAYGNHHNTFKQANEHLPFGYKVAVHPHNGGFYWLKGNKFLAPLLPGDMITSGGKLRRSRS